MRELEYSLTLVANGRRATFRFSSRSFSWASLVIYRPLISTMSVHLLCCYTYKSLGCIGAGAINGGYK